LEYCTDSLRLIKQSGETLDAVIHKLKSTAGEKEGESDLYMYLGIDLWKERKRWKSAS